MEKGAGMLNTKEETSAWIRQVVKLVHDDPVAADAIMSNYRT